MTSHRASSSADQMALARLINEYLEMPGLRLTLVQARRLMGLGEGECSRMLKLLVDRGFLFRSADGHYGRTGDGPASDLLTTGARPMARAHLRRHRKSGAA